jgi:undecaprenyl-diphosphatase
MPRGFVNRGSASQGPDRRQQSGTTARAATREALVEYGSTAYLAIPSTLCLIAIAVMTELAAGRNVLSFDISIGRWLQRESIPFGPAIADFGNAAGSSAVGIPVALIASTLLAMTRRWADAIFLMGLLLARGLNAPLKELAASPRPSSDLLNVSEFARGFGFPSGHSMGIVLLAGGLAYVAWTALPEWRLRVLPCMIAVTVVLATGYGRIDTGAHWPTDVLGGFLAGTFLLLAGIVIRQLAVVHWSLRAGALVRAGSGGVDR